MAWRTRIGIVLQEWIDLQDQFYERAGQLAYCYSERANVGLLAAAMWRCRHIAIEEFATRRCDGWRSPGRIDLFVQIGRCALCIEAKILRLRAPENESEWRTFWQLLRAKVRAARHEAARASRGTFRHRVGLVFCVLSTTIAMRWSPTRLRDLARALDSESARQRVDFLAAYMPMGRLPAEQQQYPAVILVGSATRRAGALLARTGRGRTSRHPAPSKTTIAAARRMRSGVRDAKLS